MTLSDLARSDFLPQHVAAQLLAECENEAHHQEHREDALERQHAGLWRALNAWALSAGCVVPVSKSFLSEA
jgi:hypothetical protein